MLTERQQTLLTFIDKSIQKNGISPSYQEMCDAIGLKSKSGVHRLVKALAERGYIRKLQNKARAIEVIRRPDDEAPETPESHQHGPFIPLYGKIAAGSPISAIAHQTDYIQVPTNLANRSDIYALTIEGDSMVECGILSGDTVIIEKTDAANNNEIVVALINDEEATLKRYRQAGEIVTLIPENRIFSAQSYNASEVRIQGRLIGLIRAY